MHSTVRSRIRVEGIVQGVGFRPFVHTLATRLGLTGLVGNDPAGVFIEAEGSPGAVAALLDGLRTDAPPLAVVERITASDVQPLGTPGFAIVESRGDGQVQTLVSADTATCDDCLAELSDPADRRYRYPFINCTNCGPRFTIVTGVPYDRAATTMAGFAMCQACRREYLDPSDRRYHAQPVCCPACGPHLRLLGSASDDVIAEAAACLRAGQLLAIKGLGGYHLAADAASEAAVGTLRARKHREDRPFALMVADVPAARSIARVSPAEAELLMSAARPIVLLRSLDGSEVAEAVAPGNRFLGVMLPYTPLHHLLARELGTPFVLTSGNLSDEPIAYRDEDARERLAGIADDFLVHDRGIHTRTDDSVARVVRGRPRMVRRSRGYVPQPLSLPWDFARPVLACGAELKNTFCLAKGHHAFVSHHIGDLENYETFRSFTEGIEHFCRLFDIRPEVLAHDLHPEYLSTKYALAAEGVDLVGVQHHHAHIASCLADNGEAGPVIGVAFDGLGYGTDGTLWGGEFLVADLAGFERAAHLTGVAMPGGVAAIKEPWRMAAAYLDAAFEGAVPDDLEIVRRNEARWATIVDMAHREVNAPRTTSAGRLFDAAAAILGVRDAITYEGQAAIELEQLADPGVTETYPAGLDPAETIRALTQDLRAGVERPVIAARFHNTLAALITSTCAQLRDRTGLETVALSGGVFQNLLLLDRAVDGLEDHGFRVLLHHRVPTNDGGISLGQAAVAGAL